MKLKINKNREKLYITNQQNLTDIFRSFYAHRIITKINYILTHETSLNKFQNFEIM